MAALRGTVIDIYVRPSGDILCRACCELARVARRNALGRSRASSRFGSNRGLSRSRDYQSDSKPNYQDRAEVRLIFEAGALENMSVAMTSMFHTPNNDPS